MRGIVLSKFKSAAGNKVLIENKDDMTAIIPATGSFGILTKSQTDYLFDHNILTAKQEGLVDKLLEKIEDGSLVNVWSSGIIIRTVGGRHIEIFSGGGFAVALDKKYVDLFKPKCILSSGKGSPVIMVCEDCWGVIMPLQQDSLSFKKCLGDIAEML